MALSDQAKRDIQQMQSQVAAQMTQAVIQRMEQDQQGPIALAQQRFGERKQARRFIGMEIMKVLRGRPDMMASSIPGDESAPTSEKLVAIALEDADNLIRGFEDAENRDWEKVEFEMNKEKNVSAPRIVPAPPSALPKVAPRG